ncbi:MAG: peptidyl-prolyl cis-trans isomerase [Magnetococcales bacterium]|nr:peptidyl-prolyl cis-trans isomerase [Magnetococcales bacterium]
MTRRFFYTLLLLTTLLVGTVQAADTPTKPTTGAQHPMVTLTTTLGDIVLELDETKAPITVKNFLNYVDSGFYDGLIFHRVIPGFMVQGGGMTPDMKEKANEAAIKNEADNGLTNTRGTIAMARTQVVDSATSQFFINLADNAFLNHGKRDFGYAVFGRVTSGMETVDKIAGVKTGNNKGHGDVPLEPVIILKARRT